MADISLIGHVVGIRNKSKWVVLKIAERRGGYKRSSDVSVVSDFVEYRILFKPYMRSFIQSYIPVDSLVKVKGVIVPYVSGGDDSTEVGVVDGNGKEVRQSFSIFGQTIELFPYPSRSALRDRESLKICRNVDMGNPDVEDFSTEDF